MRDPDDLTREQLAEVDPMWAAVADCLDEWLVRMHGIVSSHHNAGLFLDLLAEAGWGLFQTERAEHPTTTEFAPATPTQEPS